MSTRLSACAVLAAIAAFGQHPSPPKLRLPDAVRPIEYRADLRVDPAQDGFSGSIDIDVEVRRSEPVIWLHAKELAIVSASVAAEGREAPARAEPAGNDFLAITPDKPLPPGRARLRIAYTGTVSRSLTDGLFRQQEAGDWYLFSKFEPVTARRAFPCFDEPRFKTPWQLTLRVPAQVRAFSNTPPVGEEPDPSGGRVVRFARTRPLPSYLVALAIGPFDTADTPKIGRNGVAGRIIVPRGRAAEAAHAASITPRIVELLEEYTGIPYPYEKLDQVVVPLTTAWGGIENAALIAYGQFLIGKEKEDTPEVRRARTRTMVHEIAHQWFGDFVTTAWWDDLWLNEGVTSWITARIVDRMQPDWKTRAGQVGSRSGVMGSDSMVSARKVRQPIETPGDIANAFDGITYSKGAALVTMFENYLGEDAFRKAVRSFLKRHAWGAATSADFLGALDAAAGRPVAPAFSSFLDQGGVPLVEFDVRCDDRPALRLSQERFLPIGSAGSPAQTWKAPVCVKWSDGQAERRECFLLSEKTAEFPLRGASACPAWLLANENGAGYYRAAYGSQWLDRLLERGMERLPLEERLAVLHDAGALVSAGKMDAGQALSLARRFIDSPEREIAANAQFTVARMSQIVTDELRPNYQRLVRAWLGPRARALGWQPKPGESEDARQFRMSLLPFLAIDGEDPEIAAEAARLARVWLKDRTAVDRSAGPYTVLVAARNGDRAFFEELLAALKETKPRQERDTIVAALACFRDPAIVRSVLSLLFNDEYDPRELRGVITGQWRETRPVVWDFVRANFDKLNARLPGARGIPYGATLPSVAQGFCDAARLDEVKSFFEPRIAGLSGGARSLAATVESIRLCMARREALLPSLAAFLRGF